MSFSCCWKDVRLKHYNPSHQWKRLIRFSCCWKDVRLKQLQLFNFGWVRHSFSCCWKDVRLKLVIRSLVVSCLRFQLLLKGCTIEASSGNSTSTFTKWFQLLLKGCTIEATEEPSISTVKDRFSCCWKDVRLKRFSLYCWCSRFYVSVVVERMYDWSLDIVLDTSKDSEFQLLLKGCTIEACCRACSRALDT